MANGISIVVPAFNEEKFLPATILSLRRAIQALSAEFRVEVEILVVDNASTDRTAALADELGARVLRHEERNISAVRNAGIRAAKFEIVVTVDADNFVPEHTLCEVWRAMSSGQFVGGGVRVSLATENWRRKLLGAGLERAIYYLGGLSLGLFFFRKADAEKFGGFPEDMLVGEDSAFAILLKRHGRKCGQRYCHLNSVTMLTADRKDFTYREAAVTVWHVLRQVAGGKPTREQLKFWYNPDR